MDIQGNNKKFMKGMAVLVGIAIVLFLITQITHSILSCPYSQTEFPLPDYLKDSKIIFEKPIYSRGAGKNFYGCLSAFSDSNHLVNVLLFPEQDSAPEDKIPSGTEFTAYKRVLIGCNSISCMDQFGFGDKLLLKDNQGKIWEVNPFFLDQKMWATHEYGPPPFKAGYYKNNVRLGDIVLDPLPI